MSLRLVVWDVDGTIVDSRKIIQDTMVFAFEAAGFAPPDYEQTRQIVGLSLDDAIRTLAPSDITGTDLSDLVDGYRQAFVTLRQREDRQEPLYDGMEDILKRLAEQNCLQAIATGKTHRGLESFFEKHNLRPYFDTVWCADDGPGKPHPFMVEQAMSALGCEPDQTVMIGDAVHDMRMGKSAGVVSHGVEWGFGRRDELTASGADQIHSDRKSLALALDDFMKVSV